MTFFDLSVAELETYSPTVKQPADFDAFWQRTLEASNQFELDVTVTKIDSGLTLVDCYDLEFTGFEGQRVKAWLNMPANATPGSLPAVVEFLGYGGGRGFAQEKLFWATAGFAHITMDTRGQGSTWGSGGATPDQTGSGPQIPGVMTRGILDKDEYYYRRLFTDAVRVVDAAKTIEQIDNSKITVTGGSQGGGMTIAVAGLRDDLFAAMPDVPFLCNYERAIAITDGNPYNEITRYLSIHRNHAEQAFETLSYFDGVNFAARATTPTLFSVALMDPICPPSTVYSAYNAYSTTEKDIKIYSFNGHEGGAFYQSLEQLKWLQARLATA